MGPVLLHKAHQICNLHALPCPAPHPASTSFTLGPTKAPLSWTRRPNLIPSSFPPVIRARYHGRWHCASAAGAPTFALHQHMWVAGITKVAIPESREHTLDVMFLASGLYKLQVLPTSGLVLRDWAQHRNNRSGAGAGIRPSLSGNAKKLRGPKIGLQFRASLMNFFFFSSAIFLMWVGWSVGPRWPGPRMTPPPPLPPSGSESNGLAGIFGGW